MPCLIHGLVRHASGQGTITNNTTGDVIEINFTMEQNETLEVETDLKTVIYDKDNSNQFNTLTLTGGARRDWLKLQPGSNTLQWDDVGTGNMTITVSYEERHFH